MGTLIRPILRSIRPDVTALSQVRVAAQRLGSPRGAEGRYAAG